MNFFVVLIFPVLDYLVIFSPGIVTRRPLVLQLYNTEQGQEDYAQFLHQENKKFTDFCMCALVQIHFWFHCLMFWQTFQYKPPVDGLYISRERLLSVVLVMCFRN